MGLYKQFMESSRSLKRGRNVYWVVLAIGSLFATWGVIELNANLDRVEFVWFVVAAVFVAVSLLCSLCSLPIDQQLRREMRLREMLRLQPSIDAKLQELYGYLENAFDRETRFLEEQLRVRGQANPASKDEPSEPFFFGGDTLEHVRRNVAQRKQEFWAFHGLVKRLGYDVEDTAGAYKTPVVEVVETVP